MVFVFPAYTNKKFYSIKFNLSTIVVCFLTTYNFLYNLNTENLIKLDGLVVIKERLIISPIIFYT